ncbi:hypothetical protein LTR56_011230 [Elasticomyces elasticus]|nr:hypothetical protein LTR56_011230 [Elasticomyces elasticus]KAK4921861.1 hypothetical protein LTR49_010800 [Elasticomyces elasticus]KAK5751413.1 hypothetical protein LTS12_018501 [Elasticomyces elasticus]
MDRRSLAWSSQIKQAPDIVDVKPVEEPVAKCKNGTASAEDDQFRAINGGEAITALPVELVELIAANLTRNEQATLRATCRELAAKMQRLFVVSSFTSMRFLQSDAWSMNALVDISRHPIFSKTLRTVRLAPWSLAQTFRDGQDRDRSYKYGSRREIEHVGDPATNEMIWSKRKLHRATYQQVREEQRQSWAQSSWQAALFKALVNFKQIGARLTIDFDDDGCFECEDGSKDGRGASAREGSLIDCTCPAACGELRIERQVGWHRPLDCVERSLGSFDGRRVLHSVVTAGCKTSDLFANLELLELMLDGPDEGDEGDVLPSVQHGNASYSTGLIAFLCQARNLTVLGLHRRQPRHRRKDWTPHIETANKLLHAEILPKLDTLDLCGWAIIPEERLDLAALSAFLLRRVATIRDVCITYARKDKAHNKEDSAVMKVYLEGPNSGHQLEHFEMLGRPLVSRTASLENGF